MRFKLFGNLKKDAGVIAGEFDPLTYEHLEVFKKLTSHCHANDMNSVVILFYPRPIDFVMNKPNSVYYNDLKFIIDKILENGVDAVLLTRFSRDDAKSDARAFFPKLAKRVRFKEFWIGKGQSFGRGVGGTHEAIFGMQEALGFTAKVMEDGQPKVNAKELLHKLEHGGFQYSNEALPYMPSWKNNKEGYIICNWKEGKYSGFLLNGDPTAKQSKKHKFEAVSERITSSLIRIPLPPGKYDYFSIQKGPDQH